MSALSTFVFDDEQPHPIRVVMREREPWFVAKDACATLGIQNSRDALTALDDDEKGTCLNLTLEGDCVGLTDAMGRERDFALISESGLYTLILRSRQATTSGSLAHRFRRWVTGELLPQLRRTGRYEPDPTEGWNWEAMQGKLQMVRETRLTLGRKAAAEMWARLGLPLPEPVQKTGALQGIDFVRQFLAERTAEAPGGRVQARALNQAYADWATKTGAPPMTERAFAMCLDALGVRKARGQLVHYIGIRILHLAELLG